MNFEVKIYKTGTGQFQTKFMDPKTGTRKRKRFLTLKDAKLYKLEIESRFQNKGLAAFNDLRVSQAMQTYLERFPNSIIRDRKNHFTGFIDKFGSHRVAEINTNDLQEWLDGRMKQGNLSEKTMFGIRSQFYGFFDSLVNENYLKTNPLVKIKYKRNVPPKRPRVVMSVEEVLEVLKNAKKFSPAVLYPYLYAVAHTGARRGEILKLRREDVDFKTGLMHLTETKNGKERFVRMAPSLMKLLEEQLAGHKLDCVILNKEGGKLLCHELANTIDKFKAYFPIDKDWGCHAFRHSFAYNFLKRGGQMYQLQAILGHRNIETTVDLYGQLQAQDIENPSPYELEFDQPNERKSQ